MDITDTLKAKSDQLNADDLVGGPVTVKITKASRGNAEQPVVVSITGHQPWKPSKNMRRILAAAWGKDTEGWLGKSVTLYRDPTVKWAGEEVGGVRISHLSDLKSDLKISLQETRGKKKTYIIKPIMVRVADLDNVLGEAKLTTDQVDAWLASVNKPPLADADAQKRAVFAGWLAADSKRLQAIRDFIAKETK